ncbi:MAG: hypothetical protein H6815_07080 [Phycisphaeraceae bacterium]|nr:hypothetical protein [Phycisphaerales bacterium]MCB9860203.1 hypothetical protein [Phycisphaeraceae bacterium]
MIVAWLGLSGLVFLYKGLRGRKTSDDPHCRKCGFDLVGLPLGINKIHHCPECGQILYEKNAMRYGRFSHRLSWMCAGILLCLIAGSLVYARANLKFDEAHFRQYMPDWMLENRIMQTDGNQAIQDALLEVAIDRISAGEISGPRVRRLVEAALVRQKDTAKPWNALWGDLVEAAREKGYISDKTYNTFLLNAVGIRVVYPNELELQAEFFDGLILDRVRLQLYAKRAGSKAQSSVRIHHIHIETSAQKSSVVFDDSVDQVVNLAPLQLVVIGHSGPVESFTVYIDTVKFSPGSAAIDVEMLISIPGDQSMMPAKINEQFGFTILNIHGSPW